MKKTILMALIICMFQVQQAHAGFVPLEQILKLAIESMQSGIDSGKLQGLAPSKIIIQMTTAQDAATIKVQDGAFIDERDMKYTFYLPTRQKKCTYYTIRIPGVSACGIHPLHEDMFHVECSAFSELDQKAHKSPYEEFVTTGITILDNILDSEYLPDTPFLNQGSDSLAIYNNSLDSLINNTNILDQQNNTMIDIIDYYSSKDPQAIEAIDLQFFPDNELPIILKINGNSNVCTVFADLNAVIHKVSCKSIRA